jgi:hypothetical protein
MAYLNTTSTGFFLVDLLSGKFTLVKNYGVGNYVDYEVQGVFSGRGALRMESRYYPSTPERIFQIFADFVFPPLQLQNNSLKLSPPNEWSGKEVRVKVLVKGGAGSDGFILLDLGGSSTNKIIFVIGRQGNQMMSQIQLLLSSMPSGGTMAINFGINNWFLVDFQAKINYFTNQLTVKNVVYPVNLNPDGTFNSLGSSVDVKTLSISFGVALPSPDTLWGVNPVEVQGVAGNPEGIWLDNLAVGQGEGITEL